MTKPPPQPVTTPDQTAQVSFMITLAQKRQLRQLGYDEAAISAMTPDDAHRILDQQT
jgi:hypothetical protein